MHHFLRQALLINTAWQVCTVSFGQAHRSMEAGRTLPYSEAFQHHSKQVDSKVVELPSVSG